MRGWASRAVLTSSMVMGIPYYARFNIPESPRCDCGAPLQTRTHIICACPVYERKPLPGLLHGVVGFLKVNPLAFAFAPRI